jgi:transmembrane protein EpsG
MVFKNSLATFFVGSIGVEDRFEMYTEQYYRGGSLILTIFQLLLAIWALFKINKTLLIEPKAHLMYITFALALFFLPLQWVNPSAGRIAQYFAIIIMVWIPHLLDAASTGFNKQRKLYYFSAIVGFIVITLFAIKSEPEYNFFWQTMELPYGY